MSLGSFKCTVYFFCHYYSSSIFKIFLHILLSKLDAILAMSFVQSLFDDILGCLHLHEALFSTDLYEFSCIGQAGRSVWCPPSPTNSA